MEIWACEQSKLKFRRLRVPKPQDDRNQITIRVEIYDMKSQNSNNLISNNFCFQIFTAEDVTDHFLTQIQRNA